MSETTLGDDCDCKIGRQRDRYGLENLNERLVRRREADGESLRDLAAFVNTEVLASALSSVDADVAGDPRSVHEALVGDDVSPERRADVVDRLELVGIDVDELEGDFVSHQTVKTHLSECLGVDTSRGGVESVEEGRATVQWAADRHRTVVENVLDQLRRSGSVSIGEFDVTHTTSITCTECGKSYRLGEFLRRGACDCNDPTDRGTGTNSSL